MDDLQSCPRTAGFCTEQTPSGALAVWNNQEGPAPVLQLDEEEYFWEEGGGEPGYTESFEYGAPEYTPPAPPPPMYNPGYFGQGTYPSSYPPGVNPAYYNPATAFGQGQGQYFGPGQPGYDQYGYPLQPGGMPYDPGMYEYGGYDPYAQPPPTIGGVFQPGYVPGAPQSGLGAALAALGPTPLNTLSRLGPAGTELLGQGLSKKEKKRLKKLQRQLRMSAGRPALTAERALSTLGVQGYFDVDTRPPTKLGDAIRVLLDTIGVPC